MGEAKTALDLSNEKAEAVLRHLATDPGGGTIEHYTRAIELSERLDVIPADAPEQIDAFKAELAKVTEELATAQEHIGQPLRLRVTLTKERDAARGDAETLAEAVEEMLNRYRKGCRLGATHCPECPKLEYCMTVIGVEALAAYEKSTKGDRS